MLNPQPQTTNGATTIPANGTMITARVAARVPQETSLESSSSSWERLEPRGECMDGVEFILWGVPAFWGSGTPPHAERKQQKATLSRTAKGRHLPPFVLKIPFFSIYSRQT